ncbi:hypothetical protein OPT61_g9303 [Boeremia exigua]|uniref:Uncharacterized protein n=1 Tax=Boeremia exigua TaxID=749465 RepID=A0ACC2HV84_9PLEO|nr:hypothetical protein OPT61_g9303 [Boeremia exigua]
MASGLEVAGVVLGAIPMLIDALNLYSDLSKLRTEPAFGDIVLHILMLKDCVIVLETMRNDEMTEALETAVAESVKVGMELIERQKAKQGRARYVAAIGSPKFEDARLKFKESVTILQSLTQSLQLRKLLAEQDGSRINPEVPKAVRGIVNFRKPSHETCSMSPDDRPSLLSQRTFDTAKAGSIADVVSLADEVATRAFRNGTYFGKDLSIETGTVVILPKHSSEDRPSYVPILAKYDTGADGNFISINFVRHHDLVDRLVEIQEDGSVETVFYGLDGHEYRITHTVTLHWCSATMNKIRHTLFHVAEEVPYDLLLGNDFIMENRVLNPQRVGLPLRSKRKTQGPAPSRPEEARRKVEHERAAADEALRARQEDRHKRALEKETRKLLKEQTSASAMMSPATPSSASSSVSSNTHSVANIPRQFTILHILKPSMASQLLQPPRRQHLPSVQNNRFAINMPGRPATQIHHRSRDILRPPHPSIRALLSQLRLPTLRIHNPRRHLAHEEPRRNPIDQHVPWPQLNRQIARQMQHRGFARRVRERADTARRADADAGHAARDDDAGRVVQGGARGQEGRESGSLVVYPNLVI